MYKLALLGDAFWITVRMREEQVPEDLVDEAEDIAKTFAGAYAMRSAVGHRPFVEAWVASDVEQGLPSRLGTRRTNEPVVGDDDTDSAMLALTDVDFAFHSSVYWPAALRDIGLATVDYTDDAFLFAARGLECCARAVTNHDGNLGRGEWRALAERIGLQADELELYNRLADARGPVAHGKISAPPLVAARAQRDELLDGARDLVTRAVVSSELAAITDGVWSPR